MALFRYCQQLLSAPISIQIAVAILWRWSVEYCSYTWI